jgi:hypothetical protein
LLRKLEQDRAEIRDGLRGVQAEFSECGRTLPRNEADEKNLNLRIKILGALAKAYASLMKGVCSLIEWTLEELAEGEAR